jgi:hypothetical protein
MLDDELKIKYPDAYSRLIELQECTVSCVFGRFLKRMRRHGNYPRWGEIAPIFDLQTGEIPTLLGFDVIDKNARVEIIFFSVDTKTIYRRMIVNSIMEAWKVYEGAILESVISYHE